jgi:regulator of sigma E protease
MTWLVVALGLTLLVFLHELGHFTVARLVGIRPRALYVGFPPALVKVERKGVEYGIGAVPLGGYTRIPGMHRPSADDFRNGVALAVTQDRALTPATAAVGRALEADDVDAARAELSALTGALEQAALNPPARRSAERAVRDVDEGCAPDAYWRQPTWKRVAVIGAGPATNVLLAFVLFFAVYVTGAPSSTPSTKVAQVQANSPAAAAGLRAGDRIVAVDGRPARTFTRISTVVRGSHGRAIKVTVERDGRRLTLGPRRTVRSHGRWVWGFVPAPRLVSHPVGESAQLAGRDCWRVVTGTVASIRGLVAPGAASEVSGPVGVARTSAQALTVGFQWYLLLLGLISMSLALYNLLPLLPLDGGHILVSLVEGVRGRAVPQRVYERFSTVGMTVIVFVMLLAFTNDVGAGVRG